jgi:hypothetical protein
MAREKKDVTGRGKREQEPKGKPRMQGGPGQESNSRSPRNTQRQNPSKNAAQRVKRSNGGRRGPK